MVYFPNDGVFNLPEDPDEFSMFNVMSSDETGQHDN